MSELPSPRHNPDAVPPCPVCGAALDVSWFETIGLAGGAPRLIPGRIVCGDRPHHDVSLSANQFQIIEVAHHDHGQPYRCPLYLLGWWRDQGWFPTDLDFQTSTEAVEHRVWEQATRRS